MTGQPVARLHSARTNSSLNIAFVDVEARTFFLGSVPYSLNNFLRQKASRVRSQSDRGIDVSTVLSSKSYWHFHETVFLSNVHSGPEPCHIPAAWGGPGSQHKPGTC
jgi:hypothetical protein